MANIFALLRKFDVVKCKRTIMAKLTIFPQEEPMPLYAPLPSPKR
jgi:hypothetical protein